MAPIEIRPPAFSSATAPADFKLPGIPWLTEAWHVTHSSLPMWKSKRNVQIKYTPLPPSKPELSQENTDRIDDIVSYQSLDTPKLQTVEGIDKASSTTGGEWDWRGKGWLKIASSHWEILAWGEEEVTHNKWVVTCFAKTLFTPAGVDLYSRDSSGLTVETVDAIKHALENVGDEDVKKMGNELFEVKIDGGRDD